MFTLSSQENFAYTSCLYRLVLNHYNMELAEYVYDSSIKMVLRPVYKQ